MNPVFWLLVFLFAVLVWIEISILFKPIGGIFKNIIWALKFNIFGEEDDE